MNLRVARPTVIAMFSGLVLLSSTPAGAQLTTRGALLRSLEDPSVGLLSDASARFGHAVTASITGLAVGAPGYNESGIVGGMVVDLGRGELDLHELFDNPSLQGVGGSLCSSTSPFGHTALASGAPATTVDALASAGAVAVFRDPGFGASDFLSAADIVGSGPQTNAGFGSSCTMGRFNDDIADDLVVGEPRFSSDGGVDRGRITIYDGAAPGFETHAVKLTRIEPIGDTTDDAYFGATVAAGDFNCDGYSDLAVGAPEADDQAGDPGPADAGRVVIYHNVPAGGGRDLSQVVVLEQGMTGLSTEEAGDRFGAALTVGDFDGDHCDDLAIGVPLEDHVATVDSGYVHVLYGSPAGLSTLAGDIDTFRQGTLPMALGVSEGGGDQFGFALAAGDLDEDGRDDLAIGAPGDNTAGPLGSGSVFVLPGSGSGLVSARARVWHQDSPGVAEMAESLDAFGAALAIGLLADDPCGGNAFRNALAVGVPLEDGTFADDGAVHILPGAGLPLRADFEAGLVGQCFDVVVSN